MSLGIGTLITHYNYAKTLLKEFEFEFEEDYSKAKILKSSCFSDDFKKSSLSSDPYSEIYKIARNHSDYNLFLSSDGSFFQFSYDKKNGKDELRFAYYESPFKQISYEEFLKEHGFVYSECKDQFIEEYQQYISETELKENVTNIRYDYSEIQYKETVHPTSHLHIGQDNQVRIPLSYIMLPTSFVAFVIRNVYWEKWKKVISSEKSKRIYFKNCNYSIDMKKDYFSNIDKQDIYIHNK